MRDIIQLFFINMYHSKKLYIRLITSTKYLFQMHFAWQEILVLIWSLTDLLVFKVNDVWKHSGMSNLIICFTQFEAFIIVRIKPVDCQNQEMSWSATPNKSDFDYFLNWDKGQVRKLNQSMTNSRFMTKIQICKQEPY